MNKFSKDYNDLGKIIIEKFRDENFRKYLKLKDYYQSISTEEYNIQKNKNLSVEDQKTNTERFEFFNSLNKEQTEVLNKLILSVLNDTSFNVLREIEENLEENENIGLTINGNKVETITDEFLSGTLFGEYFLWIEKNSKYGEFQL